MREGPRAALAAASVGLTPFGLPLRLRVEFLQAASDRLPRLGETGSGLQDHRGQNLDVGLEPQVMVALLTGGPQNLLSLTVGLAQPVRQTIGLANLSASAALASFLGR